MNWDAIGAIGEIVGAVAVLITLIYLAMQIRQNSDMQRAQTYQQMDHERGSYHRMAMENKEFRDALANAFSRQPLTLDEQRILYWFTVSQLRAYDNELYQHSNGMIEDDELELQRKLLDSHVLQIEAVEALGAHMNTFTPRTQQLIRELSEKRNTSKALHAATAILPSNGHSQV
jgi:hypothetical protein